MKKIVIFIISLLLSACSSNDVVSTEITETTQPSEIITTVEPVKTDETLLATNEPVLENNNSKPYDFSSYYPTDFTVMDQLIPNGPCSGDLTVDMCIEYYGSKSSIPEGILVNYLDEDSEFINYNVENTLTGNSAKISVRKGLYDSYLSEVQYSLNENNELVVSFLYDYKEDVIEQHADAYDISARFSLSGGPLYSHTIYHLIEGNEITMAGSLINSTNQFSLIKFQNFDDYINNMNDIEYSKLGVDYLKSIVLVLLNG